MNIIMHLSLCMGTYPVNLSYIWLLRNLLLDTYSSYKSIAPTVSRWVRDEYRQIERVLAT